MFITYEIPKAPKKSKFLYSYDEWCYSIERLNLKDWPKYFLYLIYDIWFTFFSFVLNIYEDNQAIIMMDYALSLIEFLSERLKIPPTRSLFSKIIKSCGRNCLNPFIKQMLIMVKNINKGKGKYSALFHNDYLNGLYFLIQNVSHNSISASLTNSGLLMNTLRSTIINKMRESNYSIDSQLNNIIFISYNICENCLMTKSTIKKITFDEILSGFIMKNNENANTSICSNCLNRFEPKIYYLEQMQKDLNLKEVKFYSPMELTKKIDEIMQNNGEIYFYQEKEWSDIYWNIIFYFELFDLPTCVLYIQNKMEKFEKLKNKLKENKKRKFTSIKEKKTTKLNFFMGKLNKTSNDVRTDLGLDISKDSSNMSTNNVSDTSFNSKNGGKVFFSNTEMDIWTLYYYGKKQNQKKEVIENNNINKNNEDKNAIISRLKETKAFMNDNISYFSINSQEKLKLFLENYDKLERSRQYDYVNMHLKKENEKYEKKGTIQKNENLNPKEKSSNIQDSNNQQSKNKKDEPININTRYGFDTKQKEEIINEGNNDLINDKKANQEKIPLDNTKKRIQNTIIMKQETMENSNINNNNINIGFIDNVNKANTIIGIHSPQKEIINKTVYSSNIAQLNSSNLNKIKSIHLIDNNINNELNINKNREQKSMTNLSNEKYLASKNNEIYNNNIEKNNLFCSNINNINNNAIPQNYSNKTANIQNRTNTLNRRYGDTNERSTENCNGESNVSTGNTKKLKYISMNPQENAHSQSNDVQNQN